MRNICDPVKQNGGVHDPADRELAEGSGVRDRTDGQGGQDSQREQQREHRNRSYQRRESETACNRRINLMPHFSDYLNAVGLPPDSLLRCAASMNAKISRVSSFVTGGTPLSKNLTISRTSGA